MQSGQAGGYRLMTEAELETHREKEAAQKVMWY